MNGALAFQPYPSALAAETAINKQAEYGALVLGPGTPRLPPVWAFVGRFLPPGATVNIIRTAAYFHDDQHAGPFVVQAVWLVWRIPRRAVVFDLRPAARTAASTSLPSDL